MYSVIFKQEQAHEDSIWSCAWKKGQNDGLNHIVTGSVDDLVKSWKWDEERLELRHVFEGHALGVVSVDINHDGTVAASSSLDSHIRLWDLQSGDQMNSIDAGPGAWWLSGQDNHFTCGGTELGSSLDKVRSFPLQGKYKIPDLHTRWRQQRHATLNPQHQKGPQSTPVI